jgi:hypothetical protein
MIETCLIRMSEAPSPSSRDRSVAWRSRDPNVVYPIDRLRELEADGVIGGVSSAALIRRGYLDFVSVEDD